MTRWEDNADLLKYGPGALVHGLLDEIVDSHFAAVRQVAAHARGLRVIVDWVPNHTSDQHPWFREARTSRSSAKRDWYVWRDGHPQQPPNNWQAAFPRGPAWTWDTDTEQWYLRLFLPEQPDLNWGNPDVVAAMHALFITTPAPTEPGPSVASDAPAAAAEAVATH